MDDSKFFDICQLIAEGGTLKSACAELDADHRKFFKAMAASPELAANYTRARAARSDARFEDIDQIKQDLVDGKLDYNTARILIDTVKWQVGKEKAKVYGEKIQQEVTITDASVDETIRALEKRLEELQKE